MDAQQFLAEFAHIANAPGGLSQLRDLVLHFAVTGKLVQQTATDEHAEKVLERMGQYAAKSNSKKRGRSAKKISTQQTLAEGSFPTGWILAELGELGDWGAGSTPSRSNPAYYGGSIPWFKSGELKSDYITKSEEYISELALKECSLRLNVPGDVLIAMYGANIGQTSIVGIESTTNQAVCACTPYAGLNNRFLLLTLRAMKGHFIGLGAGGAQPNISKEKIVAACVGLPPTEEQSRIVAKVDELMALCDKLETQQQDRRKLQNNLRQSTLQAVATANSPHELQTTWICLADNFGQLFSAPENVAGLRSLVFDLAIKGVITNQTGADEPANKLLKRIEEFRSTSKQGKKWRHTVDGSHQKIENIPFDIPNTWEWVPLSLLGEVRTGKTPSTAHQKFYGGTMQFIGPGQIAPSGQILNSEKTLSEEGEFVAVIAEADSVMMVCIGGSIGKSCLVNRRVAINQQINCISPVLVRSEYVLAVMRSTYFQSAVLREAKGSATPIISGSKWQQLLVPIPPIEEQIRILNRVTELMSFCDSLESQLRHAQKLAERLTIAAVSSLTGIATDQEEEPMKAPQTELIAPLRLGKVPDIKAQSPLATILARHNGEMPTKDLWQRFGGEIDAFYAQLKTEVAHGWILEPAVAEMREKRIESADA